MNPANGALLETRAVTKHFTTRQSGHRGPTAVVHAVDDLSLTVQPGETLGLVGESGCGKSTLGRLMVQLLEPTSGSVLFEGQDLRSLKGQAAKAARRNMQFVFQDPQESLDPRMRVGRIVGEGYEVHHLGSKAQRKAAIRDVLVRVGLRPDAADRYPHEFSGGQRQRIGIARALIMRPRLIVADEAVSALDVSVQSQVLNLMIDLKREYDLTYVFVAHNLAIIRYIADRVAVMYLGRLVETASNAQLFSEPRHPYTQALLSSMLDLTPGLQTGTVPLRGELPSPTDPPSGCRFRTRCPIAQAVCAEIDPAPKEVADGHVVACHFAS